MFIGLSIQKYVDSWWFKIIPKKKSLINKIKNGGQGDLVIALIIWNARGATGT